MINYSTNKQAGKGRNKFLDAALWYRKNGYSVIPTNPGTKEPFSGFQWKPYKKRLPTTKEIQAWWKKWPNANIAILLGALSKLIVLDIDDESALNGHELPTTPRAISGGKRLPHLYFRNVPGARNITKLEKGAEKFSIRCDGRYIIAPPSKHESGRAYEWAPGLGIHQVPLAKPPAWMMDLMKRRDTDESPPPIQHGEFSEGAWNRKRETIIKVMRGYWTKGERNYLSLYLAGFLAKQGVPWAHTNILITEIAKLAKDTEIDQRRGNIKQTYNKAQGGEDIKGYTGLTEALSPEDLQIISNLFDTPRVKIEDSEEHHGKTDREIIPQTSFPFEVFTPELHGIIERVSQALQVEREVVASIILCFISGAIGNSVRVSPKYGYEVSPFLWLVIIAAIGYGKSPAFNSLLKPIKEIHAEKHKEYKEAKKRYDSDIRKAKLDQSIDLPEEPRAESCFVSDVTVEALRRRFEATPRGLISYHDELAGLIFGLDQYKSGGGGNDRQHYLELFDCQSWQIDRRSESNFIPNTGLAITGGIQPRIMPKVFSPECFDDGLLPRFIFINAGDKPMIYSRLGIDKEDMTYWNDLLKACYEIPTEVDDNGFVKPAIVRLTEKSLDRWEAFYNEYGQFMPFLSERARIFIPKLLTYTLKFIGILHILAAYSEGRAKGRIIKIIKITDFSREKILEDAIKLTRFFAGQAINTLELYKPKGKQWNEYETRMVKTLYELQGRVDKGDLLFSAIVETYNKKLPENLRKEPKSISTLLEKSFDLHTHKGTDNVTFLIWEESKIRKIFSRMIDNLGNFDNSSYPTNSQHLPSRTTLTSLTQENGNPAIHSEACDCPECAPAVLEEASSFELIGKPVNADGVTIQKARSRAGVIIYMVQELKNGRQATRWAYPSDREYSKIAETHEENQPL